MPHTLTSFGLSTMFMFLSPALCRELKIVHMDYFFSSPGGIVPFDFNLVP